nr:MAG TPA: hypothetical protein [Caudoviricetes sp.]
MSAEGGGLRGAIRTRLTPTNKKRRARCRTIQKQ